jgi:predicted RNase H-like HicB family nuclease
MSDYHINVFSSDEDAAYVADIPDLEACSALVQRRGGSRRG